MKKDIIWNSLGTTAWSLLSLFLLIIVTRINGVMDSGLFSFAFAVAMIMFTICCYGGRAYQVTDHKNTFDSSNYISLRIITSVAVLIITTVFVVINGYDWHKAALIFILVGYRIFDALADVFYGILQKKNHLYISGKSLFFKSILSLIIFLIVDTLTQDLLLATLSLPIISFVFIVFYDIPQSRKLDSFSIKPEPLKIKRILKSTFLPFTIAVMGLIFANLARYFIDIYHPDLQGYFGIIIMPLSVIILLFSFISTPAILHMSDALNRGNPRKLNTYIGKILAIMAIGTLLLCISTYLIGVKALNILFGLDFSGYITDIILVLIIGLMVSFTALFTNVAIIARRLRFTSFIYLLTNVLLILLCILLVDHQQIHGAIVAYIIASTTQALIMGFYYLYLLKDYKLSKKS